MINFNEQLLKLTPEQRILVQKRLGLPYNLVTNDGLPEFYPISPQQKRIWAVDKLFPDQPINNIAGIAILHGHFDVHLYWQAFSIVIERHEILRTKFEVIDGIPYQKVVNANKTVNKLLKNFEVIDPEERIEHVNKYMLKKAIEPFDITIEPPIRVIIGKLSDTEHYILGCMHHIVSDGLSTIILLKESFSVYQELVKNHPAALPKLPFQYKDYCIEQRFKLFENSDNEKIDRYVDTFRDLPAGLFLPIDRTRPADPTNKAGRVPLKIPPYMVQDLREFARNENVTIFMLLLAVYSVLLNRYSHQNIFGIGIPHAGRSHQDLENLVGCFVNLLPLRIDVSNEPSFQSFIQNLRGIVLNAFEHSHIPFETFLKKINPERHLGISPLFQTLFSFERAPYIDLPDDFGISVDFNEISLQVSPYDLSLELTWNPKTNAIEGWLDYSSDVFNHDSIQRMGDSFVIILADALKHPNKPISQLEILSKPYRDLILFEWNKTARTYPKDRTIHELFEKQVKKTPKNLALVFENTQLNYLELNEKANQLAHLIQKRSQSKLIGLCVERSIDMIVAILSILKAGAAYVPLDPNYPKDRLEYLIKDLNEGLIISQKEVVKKHEFLNTKYQDSLVLIDSHYTNTELQKQSSDNLNNINSPDDLAYVIYTSGSTGTPKGVMIEHSNVINCMYWLQEEYGLRDKDKVLQKTPFNFDVSVGEYLWSLLFGATLVIAEQEGHKDPYYLSKLIKTHQITVTHFVPSQLQLFIDLANCNNELKQDLSSIEKIFCAGESLNVDLIKSCMAIFNANVYNLYGPTEASIFATSYQFHPNELNNMKIAPIGKPGCNIQTYILDKNRNLCPIGVPGELHIGGAGVARGYLYQETLTQECFIDNPFSNELGLFDKNFIYKTGDLARWLPNGNIEFLGRLDFQIKIRGFRVELGEIENTLASHKSISQTAVIALEESDKKYLVAYYVVPTNLPKPNGTELQIYLSNTLPDYMVPSIFVNLEEMPLTSSGKIDRKALPAPSLGLIMEGHEYPRNEIEKQLSEIWCQLLNLDCVGIHDNFYSLGGDSILSIQVINQARMRNMYFSAKDFLKFPTIAQLSSICLKRKLPDIKQGPVLGNVPLTPIQQWFFKNSFETPNHWNQAQMLKSHEKLDIRILERALTLLTKHHDTLRLRYKKIESGNYLQYYENDYAELTIPIQKIDLSTLKPEDQPDQISHNSNRIQKSLDISNGPIVAVGVFSGMADGYDRLLIAIHHLVVDGISWRILIPDLQYIYYKLKENKNIELPSKTSSFQDWSHSLIYYAENKAIQDYDYWLNLKKIIRPLITDYACKQDYATNLKHLKVSLDEQRTNDLLTKAPNAHHTEIIDLLLSAFSLALACWQGTNDVSFNIEGHGRESCISNIDITRTLGWFTSLFPFAIHLPKIQDWDTITELEYKSCIQYIKEQIRKIPSKGISFGLLKYLHPDNKVRENFDTIKSPQLTFNYLGQLINDKHHAEEWGLSNESSGLAISEQNHNPNLIEINGAIIDGKMGFNISISTDHYGEESIDRFGRLFRQFLLGVIQHCTSQKKTAYTTSDFITVQLSQTFLNELPHPESVKSIYALTPLQEGMLFHTLHSGKSDQYCVQIEWSHFGLLNSKALKTAWQNLINNHDVLRTRFVWEGLEDPIQVVEKEVAAPWIEIDFSQLNKQEKNKKLDTYLIEDRIAGFDLTRPCAMRLHLIKLGEDSYRFIWTSHHIILDGWSLPILVQELSNQYDAIENATKPIIANPIPFERYVEFLKKQDGSNAKEFWTKQLSKIETTTDLRIQKSEAKINTNKLITNIGFIKKIFDKNTSKEIIEFAKQNNVTINSVIQLAFSYIFYRYSGETSVMYGSVLSGRAQEVFGIDKIVGLLINTLPIVITFEENRSIANHLRQVHQTIQEINHYSYCSLIEVQKCSSIQLGDPMFNVLFAFENYPTDTLSDTGNLEAKDIHVFEKTNYPLTLSAYVYEDQLEIKIVYDEDLYEAPPLRRMLSHMTNFIQQAMLNPDQLINRVEILDGDELKQILIDWNKNLTDYPKNKTIHELFEEQAAKNPNNIALSFLNQEMTYQELNQKANQLASFIQEEYLKRNRKIMRPNTAIGLCMNKSFDMLIAILAILKAGGIYIPLDPEYPKHRIEHIITDSKQSLIITHTDVVDQFAFLEQSFSELLLVVDRNDIKVNIQNYSQTNLGSTSSENDLAYVIYTSGTTGNPKGVMLEHRAINSFAVNPNFIQIRHCDKIAHLSNSAFDASIFELWATLLNGAQVVLTDNETLLNLNLLDRFLNERKISIFFVTTALFNVMVDHGPHLFSSPRAVLFGGEAVNTDKVKKFIQFNTGTQLIHVYGPTETICFSTYHPVNRNTPLQSNLPIGTGTSNKILYILDKNFNILPVGIPGELYISGGSLARGYLNQETLTDERFILNPFSNTLDFPNSDRIYKTGDLVKWLPDGTIEYIGRIDFQVKIRGFRIELGEIENSLSKHPSLSQVSVIAFERGKQKYLAAYYVIQPHAPEPSIESLRDYLSKTLPNYMIPLVFIKLDKIPLTPSGKMNQKALPNPEMNLSAQEYVAPSNELEHQLTKIWSEIFNLEQVGIHDHFYSLGGHSLNLLKMHSMIKESLPFDVSVADIIQYQTIRELSKFLYSQAKDDGERDKAKQRALLRKSRGKPHHYRSTIDKV